MHAICMQHAYIDKTQTHADRRGLLCMSATWLTPQLAVVTDRTGVLEPKEKSINRPERGGFCVEECLSSEFALQVAMRLSQKD